MWTPWVTEYRIQKNFISYNISKIKLQDHTNIYDQLCCGHVRRLTWPQGLTWLVTVIGQLGRYQARAVFLVPTWPVVRSKVYILIYCTRYRPSWPTWKRPSWPPPKLTVNPCNKLKVMDSPPRENLPIMFLTMQSGEHRLLVKRKVKCNQLCKRVN